MAILCLICTNIVGGGLKAQPLASEFFQVIIGSAISSSWRFSQNGVDPMTHYS
jgi:hypothetical protein